VVAAAPKFDHEGNEDNHAGNGYSQDNVKTGVGEDAARSAAAGSCGTAGSSTAVKVTTIVGASAVGGSEIIGCVIHYAYDTIYSLG
jgi:hypothetical protein